MFGSISAFHRGLAGMTFALLLAGILPAPIAQAAGQSAGDQTTMNTTGTFIPELDLPGVFSGPQTSDSGLLARYLRAVFIYFIWVVGIVAGVMVVYAGVRWISAAGNPGQIKEAREILDGAVIGVIIALTSVLLLNIINPRLTELTLPGIAPIKQQPVGGSEAVTLCAREASDTKTPCGTFAKLPFQVTKKTADVAGTVDVYCLGTVCSQTSTVCPVREIQYSQKDQWTMTPPDQYRQLFPGRPSTFAVTKYYDTDGGCQDKVTIQPPTSGALTGVAELRVRESEYENVGEGPQQTPLACGFAKVSAGQKIVGSSCPDHDCAVINQPVKVKADLSLVGVDCATR